MIDVKLINQSLEALIAEGLNIPSASTAVTHAFSDVFNEKGLIRSNADTNRVEYVFNNFSELFNPINIRDNADKSIRQMIVNFNSTVPPTQRIDVTNLTRAQYSAIRAKIERGQLISNIYLPDFGLSLKEAIAEGIVYE